jgi:plastocyanin
MTRLRLLALLSSATAAFVALSITPAPAQAPAKWVTIQGQVLFPKETAIPAPVAIDTKGQDTKECEKKGPLHKDDLIINPKNRGLKNVWVYLRPDDKDRKAALKPEDINPTLAKPAPKTHVVDQPCCMFIPKTLALRSGDFIDFQNNSPTTHNVKFDADAPSPSQNKTLAPKGSYKDPLPFVAQASPATYSCSIHPWMAGKFMIFDHPYFAVTDDDGKFEIKDAPAGKYRLVYRHSEGYHKGKDGAAGWEVTIAPGANGTMEMKPIDFEFPKP